MDLMRIQTNGIPTKKLKETYSFEIIKSESQFMNLVFSNFNFSPGSCFCDNRKAYFFGSNQKACYAWFKGDGEPDK